jgi:hypothetical protein
MTEAARMFSLQMDDDEKKVDALANLVAVIGYIGEGDERIDRTAVSVARTCLAYALGREPSVDEVERVLEGRLS